MNTRRAVIVLLGTVLLAAQSIGAQQTDVKTFVRQTFIHGVPYAQARLYGTADATVLLQMLADESEKSHWANIVVTLGMIGDERAVGPLIALVASGNGTVLTAAEYAVKTSALISLGYLLNKTGSANALTYLTDGLHPDVWTARGLNWTSPFQVGATERNRHMMSLSVIGLALSGNATARNALLTFQLDSTLTASDKALVEEALRANATIASQGLEGYYQNEDH